MDSLGGGKPLVTMTNPVKLVDRFQQRVPGVSFVVAVLKKASDDRAGQLAALVADYPGFGTLLVDSVTSFHETGIALAASAALTFLGTRGVANAMQNVMNTV